MSDDLTTPNREAFDLRPDERGFRYVLMWMSFLQEKGFDADLSYVLEWHGFVEQCRDIILKSSVSETNARDAALEEAADLCDRNLDVYSGTDCTYRGDLAEKIRAMKGRP